MRDNCWEGEYGVCWCIGTLEAHVCSECGIEPLGQGVDRMSKNSRKGQREVESAAHEVHPTSAFFCQALVSEVSGDWKKMSG